MLCVMSLENVSNTNPQRQTLSLCIHSRLSLRPCTRSLQTGSQVSTPAPADPSITTHTEILSRPCPACFSSAGTQLPSDRDLPHGPLPPREAGAGCSPRGHSVQALVLTHHTPAAAHLRSLGSSPGLTHHFPGSGGIGPKGEKHLESRKQTHPIPEARDLHKEQAHL